MATYNGTSSNNSLVGTSGNDIFNGSDGSDSLNGNGGSDSLVYGGINGPITLTFANVGTGTVTKPTGTDTFSSVTFVSGTTAGDTLAGLNAQTAAQNITLRGRSGNDTISGFGSLINRADYLDSPGAVTVDLAAGAALDGWGSTDTLVNVARARGSAFADVLLGSAGDDLLDASGGNDSFDGRGGFNTLSYNNVVSVGPVTVTFATSTSGSAAKADGSTDTFTNINGINGSNSNDLLLGTTATNGFFAVSMRGYSGNDVINGQSSTFNVADYRDSPVAITADLAAGSTTDGWGGTDTLTNVRRISSTGFNDTLLGSNANDIFELAQGGSHTVDGRGGSNQVRYEGADAAVVDLAAGTIVKAGGTDRLTNISSVLTSGGNDTLLGGAGDDTLGGGAGVNGLDGRGGYNTLFYNGFNAGEPTPTHGAIIDLGAGVATNMWDGTDSFTNFQAVIGSRFDDVIIASTTLSYAVDGAGGTDTVAFAGTLASYDHRMSGGALTLTSGNVTTTIRNVEMLQFAGQTITVKSDPVVDYLYYNATYSDIASANVDARTHYDAAGWHEGRNPNAFFSTTSYLTVNSDVAGAGLNPLTHYEVSGWREGRDPSAAFDTSLYLTFNPDVAAAGINPLVHYLQAGQAEGRKISPVVDSAQISNGFDALYYKLSNPDVAAAGVDPFTHYLASGAREGRDPNAFFDTSSYLASNPDVAAAGVNPLKHYMAGGWREGRDPSSHFDTSAYLEHYTDVAAAGINPLQHFLVAGIAEGRSAYGDLI